MLGVRTHSGYVPHTPGHKAGPSDSGLYAPPSYDGALREQSVRSGRHHRSAGVGHLAGSALGIVHGLPPGARLDRLVAAPASAAQQRGVAIFADLGTESLAFR